MKTIVVTFTLVPYKLFLGVLEVSVIVYTLVNATVGCALFLAGAHGESPIGNSPLFTVILGVNLITFAFILTFIILPMLYRKLRDL